jgi:hypothetical protein
MSSPPEDTAGSFVRVERHRAERLADLAVVGSICCSSCCCCCCCVHAIGGVAGAAVGSARAASESAPYPEALRGVKLVNAVYWIGFASVALLAAAIGLVSDHLWASLLVVALGAPVFQLGMSVLVLPVAAAQSGLARKGAFVALRLVTIGAIGVAVAGGVVLAVLGLGVMAFR